MILFLASLLRADPLPNYLEGNAFLEKGEYSKAIESYQDSLEEKGPNTNIYWGLGNALFLDGKKLSAGVAWTRAQKLQPWNSEIKENLSQLDKDIAAPLVPKEIGSWGASVCLFLSFWFWSRKRQYSFLFVFFFFLFAASLWHSWENDKIGYIVLEDISVRSTPSSKGISLFFLKKGDDFRIIERRSANYFIEKDKKRGWISQESFLSLNPTDPFFISEE